MITLRFLLATFLLALSSVNAWAEIRFAIGEPSANSIKSGVGQISGWAVSDNTIVSVEALINDVSLGNVPYGGSRLDVANAYPGFPDAEFSGWAMKWNYSLLADGDYVLKIIVTDDLGDELIKEANFAVVGFHSEFISDPTDVQTFSALVQSPEDGRIVIEGAMVEGEPVDIELAWDTASQQFLIDTIEYTAQTQENQAPQANAGNDRIVEQEAAVVVTGNAVDSDEYK